MLHTIFYIGPRNPWTIYVQTEKRLVNEEVVSTPSKRSWRPLSGKTFHHPIKQTVQAGDAYENTVPRFSLG
jgi:hypothetical protein